MKFATIRFVAFAILLTSSLLADQAAAAVIYIDFAGATQQVNGINQMDANTAGCEGIVVSDLIDSTGLSTGISFTTTQRGGDVSTSGTSSPTGDAEEFAFGSRTSLYIDAAGDGSYTNYDSATFVFGGLTAGEEYTFTFFASRILGSATDNREALYTLTGENEVTATLDGLNNTSNVASATVTAAADGTVTLVFTAGPNNTNSYGFAYLSAMKIEETSVPEPASLALLGLGGIAAVIRRRRR